MDERWRKPLTVLAIEPGNEMVFVDGKLVRSTKIIYDRESTERIRLGYACAKCQETFERPWPVTCSLCGAPIRDRQLEYFVKEYGGEVRIGPSTSISDERARLREWAEQNPE